MVLKELCETYLEVDSTNGSLMNKSPYECLGRTIGYNRESHRTSTVQKNINRKVINRLSLLINLTL